MSESSFLWRIENILAQEQFDEVFETATEACLSQPERMQEIATEVEVEREFFATADRTKQLGLWGIKACFENAENWVYHYSDESCRSTGLLPNSDIVLQPDEFSAPPNQDVHIKIEAFGKALIEESFACLGEDADEYARTFASDELSTQVETLNWLSFRIMEIRDKVDTGLFVEDIAEAVASMQVETEVTGESVQLEDEPSDDMQIDSSQYYHPIRLSPKAIGTYPDTLAKPTCLGLSILAAAFFEKAGVPYLHTGVAETATQNVALEIDTAIGRIQRNSEQYEMPVCQKAADLFERSEEALVKSFENENGHHAAVLAKLNGDKWILLDPNFTTNVIMDNTLDKLDERYETQRSLNARYPGVDTMFPTATGALGLIAISTQLNIKSKPDINGYTEVLVDAYESDDPYDIFETYILERTDGADLLSRLIDVYMSGQPESKVSYLRKKVEELVHGYVFPDAERGNLRQSLERCANDPAYLRRRVEDLHFLPNYFVLSITGDIKAESNRRDWNFTFPHSTLEVGMPHFRIGACVLSDFDVYSGGNIPMSFWQANWTSHVSFEDHVPSEKASAAQRELGVKVANNMRSSRLRYFTSRGITKPFLEQEGEINNGSSQE